MGIRTSSSANICPFQVPLLLASLSFCKDQLIVFWKDCAEMCAQTMLSKFQLFRVPSGIGHTMFCKSPSSNPPRQIKMLKTFRNKNQDCPKTNKEINAILR